MNEIMLGKIIDLAFTSAFTKLNRDEVAAKAREMLDNEKSLEDVANWLLESNQASEDEAQAAIDAMP